MAPKRPICKAEEKGRQTGIAPVCVLSKQYNCGTHTKAMRIVSNVLEYCGIQPAYGDRNCRAIRIGGEFLGRMRVFLGDRVNDRRRSADMDSKSQVNLFVSV
jgi:hypothetical protein